MQVGVKLYTWDIVYPTIVQKALFLRKSQKLDVKKPDLPTYSFLESSSDEELEEDSFVQSVNLLFFQLKPKACLSMKDRSF